MGVCAAVLVVATQNEEVEIEGKHVQLVQQVLHDEEGGEHLLHLDGDGGEQLLPIDVENPGGVLADGLDKYGEGREEGEGAGLGGGSLKL